MQEVNSLCTDSRGLWVEYVWHQPISSIAAVSLSCCYCGLNYPFCCVHCSRDFQCFSIERKNGRWVIVKRKLDGCIVWNAHNTVFGSKCLAVCAQAVYLLHLWALVLRHSVVDGDWLPATEWFSVICRIVYPHQTSQKIRGGCFYGVYRSGEWLWVDSNGKNWKLEIQ